MVECPLCGVLNPGYTFDSSDRPIFSECSHLIPLDLQEPKMTPANHAGPREIARQEPSQKVDLARTEGFWR